MPSRRDFLAIAAAAPAIAKPGPPPPSIQASVSLNGSWLFRIDAAKDWRGVTVPHTWQIEPENAGYMGAAWYRRILDIPVGWSNSVVRIEFEAVFHTATVWVNGSQAGRHEGMGYTAFAFDIGSHLKFGAVNTIDARVDNSFSESMLPRGRSSDWAHDGGLYRPVRLLVAPKVYIERIAIDAEPDFATGEAARNSRARPEHFG